MNQEINHDIKTMEAEDILNKYINLLITGYAPTLSEDALREVRLAMEVAKTILLVKLKLEWMTGFSLDDDELGER